MISQRFIIATLLAVLALTPFASSVQAVIEIGATEDSSGSDVYRMSGPVNTSGGGVTASFDGGVSLGATGTGGGASACSTLKTGGFVGVVDCIIVYFNYAIYLITAATVVYTVRGAFNMMASEDKRGEGKIAVYYGIIGLFLMVSIWGLVNILDSTFKLSGGSPAVPAPLERVL